ncbi:MAG: DUF624 domain-containing protein [Ruminococcaceae bacterium]|nr:DUF624 domain-containing protein [Oscillospiraceae bacterium]
MKKNDKNKRLRLFDLQKDGKGISKNQADLGPGLKKFFISYKNNFNKLISVNIFMVLGNFPIIFLICNLSGYFKTGYFIPFSDLFQNIAGIFASDGELTPYKMTLYALEGLQRNALAPTAINYVFYALGALTLFTFGPVNTGCAYIIRNMVNGEPVFPWSDFWYAVKRNIKQSLPLGMIDLGITVLLGWNLYTMISSTADFFASMLFWSNVVLFILYFFMRYYLYVQAVTFKLTIFKIIKNSLIFALLGFKRNIAAFFGIILVLIIELALMFATGGILVPLAVAAPLAMLFSSLAFIKVYAAYPKIKEHMIDPYLEEHPEEKEPEDDIEPIMKDDVTERERLEAIKKNMKGDGGR